MDNAQSVTTRRPIGVWLISIFFLLSAAYTLVSFKIVLSGRIPLSDAQRAYFASMTTLDYVLTMGVCLANLTGAISLFLLRKVAFQLFLIAFLTGLAMTAWQVMFKGWLSAVGGPGLVGAEVGWITMVVILLYIKTLVKNGILH